MAGGAGSAASGRGMEVGEVRLSLADGCSVLDRTQIRYAPLGLTRDFDLKPVTPLFELANILRPGATGKDLVELLDGRAERTQALHWRAGRRGTPTWALQLLADKIERDARERLEQANRARQAKERPGLKAGALNLAKWKARR